MALLPFYRYMPLPDSQLGDPGPRSKATGSQQKCLPAGSCSMGRSGIAGMPADSCSRAVGHCRL